jgi:hypothetical protein
MARHECSDAAQFAAWGADYLFEDFCGATGHGWWSYSDAAQFFCC